MWTTSNSSYGSNRLIWVVRIHFGKRKNLGFQLMRDMSEPSCFLRFWSILFLHLSSVVQTFGNQVFRLYVSSSRMLSISTGGTNSGPTRNALGQLGGKHMQFISMNLDTGRSVSQAIVFYEYILFAYHCL